MSKGERLASEARTVHLISRVVAGWNVRMSVNGKRTSRFFADSIHGGKKAALKSAQAYRETLVNSRPVKKQIARPLSVVRGNTTCVQIRLPLQGGGTTTTEFSIQRHGLKKARQFAIHAFEEATKRINRR